MIVINRMPLTQSMTGWSDIYDLEIDGNPVVRGVNPLKTIQTLRNVLEDRFGKQADLKRTKGFIINLPVGEHTFSWGDIKWTL